MNFKYALPPVRSVQRRQNNFTRPCPPRAGSLQSTEAFYEVSIPDLDHAYTSGQLEAIAVRGNEVLMITFPMYEGPKAEEILTILFRQWSNAME